MKRACAKEAAEDGGEGGVAEELQKDGANRILRPGGKERRLVPRRMPSLCRWASRLGVCAAQASKQGGGRRSASARFQIRSA